MSFDCDFVDVALRDCINLLISILFRKVIIDANKTASKRVGSFKLAGNRDAVGHDHPEEIVAEAREELVLEPRHVLGVLDAVEPEGGGVGGPADEDVASTRVQQRAGPFGQLLLEHVGVGDVVKHEAGL